MPVLTGHELRVCDHCGREVIRPKRERRGELPCGGCGGENFLYYDPVWVERQPTFTEAHDD